MFDVVKKLLIARQLTMEKGRLLLLGVPMAVVPVSIFIELQKGLEDALGKEEARKRIYEGAEEGGQSFSRKVQKKYGLRGEKLLKWEFDIVMLGGWGEFKLVNFDKVKKRMIVQVYNSPLAQAYGKSDSPVDCYISGFSAGGLNVTMEAPMEVKEVKCIAMGHPYCEFIAQSKMEKKI